MVFAFVYQQSVSIIITHSDDVPSLLPLAPLTTTHSLLLPTVPSPFTFLFLYKYLRGILSGFFILSDLCRFSKSHSQKEKSEQ